MTVSQIRELMLERVVPESLLPQNIAECLCSEEAAPPELDAFTFLNRLRSLGIGSADFLYLLKGCGAPEQAVEKIEQRPDMNLQSLIVTLDGSGLTPKDYTRMLYTARQLWERTITMRIDTDDITAEAAEQPEQPEQKQQPIRTAKQRKRSNAAEDIAPTEPEKPLPRTARQKKKSEQEFREYAGVKPIGKRDIPDEADEADDAEKPEVRTAVQLKTPPKAEENGGSSQEKTNEGCRARRRALAACAAGAAVVCAADIGIGLLGFSAQETADVSLHFAESNSEIFAEIYEAYSNDRIGGCIQSAAADLRVFGDLLIDSGEQLGVFSDNDSIFVSQPDMITVYGISGDTAEETALIEPPEGARFVRVFQTESGMSAVFSGDNFCGVIGADENGQDWISQQSGSLTDIGISDGGVKLGSVYTPSFSESFTVEDELAYMPWTELSGVRTALSAEETAVTGTAQGCSYAVNVGYSAAGEITSRTAILGNPVYSGAEFLSAAMYQENGMLLATLDGSSPLTCKTVPEITACAVGNGIVAAAEKSGDGITVYLRDSGLNTISAFTAEGDVSRMSFSGDTLLLGSGDTVTLAADISEPEAPKPLSLTAAAGTVNGEYALCGSTSAAGMTLTLYQLADGKAVQADSYSKTLTAAQLESFSFCGANTAVINGTDCCGAAYSWFDGVSVVSEFAEMGKSRSLHTLYDDPDGFTAAAYTDNGLLLLCGSRKQ